MSIIGGPEKIDKDKVVDNAIHYAKENDLSDEQAYELVFICDSFRKYYNNCSDSASHYSPSKILSNFERDILPYATGGEIGISTNADVLYKEISPIKEIVGKDNLEKKIKKPRTRSSTSYGSCGGGPSFGRC